jgi:lysozyme
VPRIKIENPRRLVASAALVALLGVFASAELINFTAREEGEVRTPYKDVVGVLTVCFGSTRNIENRPYSADECERLFNKDLYDHAKGLVSCFPELVDAPDGVKVAYADFAFNVGVGAACRSTAVRRYRNGDAKGGCEALLMFNKAGGKFNKGLDGRRRRELELCARGELEQTGDK